MPHHALPLAPKLPRRSLLVGAGVTLACGRAALPRSSPSKHLGEPIPAFTGTTVNGSEYDSNSSLGMVLVVQFFALSCESCSHALVDAGELYADHRELVMVGVSLDPSIQSARGLVTRHSLKFPVLFDPEGSVAERLGVEGPKVGLAVDRRGILRWVGDPARPGVVREAAEALLG
jgi:peroxiredoxin